METKRTKVIMLPIKSNSGILFIDTNDNSLIYNKPDTNIEFTDCSYQHLYFTTDDEIKEGDWIYNPYRKDITNTYQVETTMWCDYKKIIATTDKSLNGFNSEEEYNTIRETRNRFRDRYAESISFREGNIIKERIKKIDKDLTLWENKLPQPSQAFIEKYCKVGGIDEVLVEYEKVLDIKNDENGSEWSNLYLNLKVDSHNTITIHPIKDSWSKEEVKDILYKAFKFVNTDVLPTGFLSRTRIDDWVKENL